jgi:N-acetylglucosaminyldiphosphoundecaprenol N-acetyl-beta-D-mannosaminyltransferase
MNLPAKAPVVGTPISLTSYDEILELFDQRGDDCAIVVAVCNVHSVMSARRNPDLARALNSAHIATPDGVPIVWTLRRTANPGQQRVYGPDLMRMALSQSDGRDWRHYLYGSTPQTLATLEASIADFAPDATIVGRYSPPFRPSTPEEDAADAARILASGANIVWVGLGMPKQELWMHRVAGQLPGTVVLGVGAAFDFLAGITRQAPPWMQRAGLEWVFRLSQEPRRLWRRYIWNNPAFAILALRQILADSLRRRGADPGRSLGSFRGSDE